MRDVIKPMSVVKPIQFTNFSFSRSTIAKYYDSAGLLAVASVDVLRQGYNPQTLVFIGPIIETAATNELLHSNDLTNSSWTKVGSITITNNATTSPDGTTNACSVTSGSWDIKQYMDGIDKTFSIYAKRHTDGLSGLCTIRLTIGTTTCVFILNPGSEGALESFGHVEVLQDGWCRISMHAVTSSPDVLIISSVSTASYYLYEAQGELSIPSYLPSSHITTTTVAVTRAADVQSAPPAVLDSNIPETDHPDYVGATTYALGDMVMVRDPVHRNYQSIASSNTGHYPPSNPDKWLDAGATNRWRMFDMKVGADLVSANTGTIDVTVSVAEIVNTVGIFNVDAQTVRVRMYSDSVVVYDQTFSTAPISNASTWHAFFFGTKKLIKNIVITDLPPYAVTNIQVTATGYDEDYPVELGKLVIGSAVELGFTEYGSSVGIRDYSTKEPDTFGNYYIQERRFTKKAELKVVVDPWREDFVVDTLAELRATASCFIGHPDYTSLLILGFPEDFSVLFSTPASSYLSLTITGI